MPENDIDLDALQAEWEAEFADEEQEETEEEAPEESEEAPEEDAAADQEEDAAEETEEEEAPEEDAADAEEVEEAEESTPGENPDDAQHQQQLLALQKQLEEAQKAASVFDEIAKENGVSREELLKQYERKQLEDQAKKENVPVEYLQRQRDMEKELAELKENQRREQFNQNVGSVVEKYKLSDADVRSTLDYAYQNGLDPFTVNFESIYKAANFETILEKQMKETRQQELAAKQKRMAKSTVTHGGSATPGPSVDDEVAEFLKSEGIL